MHLRQVGLECLGLTSFCQPPEQPILALQLYAARTLACDCTLGCSEALLIYSCMLICASHPASHCAATFCRCKQGKPVQTLLALGHIPDLVAGCGAVQAEAVVQGQ